MLSSNVFGPSRYELTAVGFISLLLACHSSPPPRLPSAPEPVEAANSVNQEDVCAQTCNRLSNCSNSTGSATPDPTTTPCESACLGGTLEPSYDPRHLAHCLDLEGCIEFSSCIDDQQRKRSWLGARSPSNKSNPQHSCGQLCRRSAGCMQESAESDLDALSHSRLEDRCLTRCDSSEEHSRAHIDLLACIEHLDCDGLLGCLDDWAQTGGGVQTRPRVSRHSPASRAVDPGLDEACHQFCARAIECGAESEGLRKSEVETLQEAMTGIYVECAVQCGIQRKATKTSSDDSPDPFSVCAAKESCGDYDVCAADL